MLHCLKTSDLIFVVLTFVLFVANIATIDLGFVKIKTIPASYLKLSTPNVLRCGKICDGQVKCAAVTFDYRDRMCFLHDTVAVDVENGTSDRLLFKKYTSKPQTNQSTCEKDMRITVPSARSGGEAYTDIEEPKKECPASMVKRGYVYDSTMNICYAWRKDRKTWTDAQDACKSDNGHLLFINNCAIHDWAIALIKTGYDDNVYIDGTDADVEGVYKNYKGQAMTYMRWGDDEQVCAVNFKLAIIHTNDIEARFTQTDKYGMECSDSDAASGKCFAGVARRASKIKELRNDMTNTILLDAGGQFQGTVWYSHYKGAATAYFMNKLQYTAMALSNSEFDDGIDVLNTFARNLTFPLLSSNLNISREPRLLGNVLKSTVLNVANERIGVIGYTTTKTAEISMPGDTVSFDDIIVAVRREAEALTANGVDKIIAVGHAGFEMDKKIAKEVSNIDIVVGGHSYTFLYTGKQPSNDKPVGPYPTVVKSLDGNDVPVVTAFHRGKYLGHIILEFNARGNVVSWEGSPILLDNSTTQDADVLADVERFSGPIDEYTKEVIGYTRVYLEGGTWFCRAAECNMGTLLYNETLWGDGNGNLFTDALVWFYQSRTLPGKGWTDAVIAIVPGGGIRGPITIGPITMADLTTTFPYGNQIDIISLEGEHLYKVLEYCASRFSLVKRFGGFLQMSGMRVKYDMNQPIGSRVVSAKVLCTRCNMPTYYPINRTEVYRVIMDDFLINGGDGYASIKDNYMSRDKRKNIDVSVLREYIRRFTPVVAVADGRIEFVEESECSPSSATRSVKLWYYLTIITLTATLLVQCS